MTTSASLDLPGAAARACARCRRAVVLRDLRREYDGREVVRGVSLEIREGEIFGLLGPNGAGKTTLLSMISTRIRPTSGDVWVYGKHVVHDVDAARRLLNVAPQEEALYPSLTAPENLAFFAELYGVPRASAARASPRRSRPSGSTGRKDDRVATYSGGMRRRLNLGCALVSGRGSSSSTSRPSPSTRSRGRTSSMPCGRCARAARRSSTRPTTSRRPRTSATASRSWTRAGSWPRHAARAARPVERDRGHRAAPAQPPETIGPLRPSTACGRSRRSGTSCASSRRAPSRCCRASIARCPRSGTAIVRTRVTPVTLDDVFLELTGKELRD